ncbi:hypothetical protein OKA05_09730 [Luteolibacter arcticus]|uniref:Chalcone isomerase domain-containing protein n=1 Tax=Luteolibacter arcticus TaxID=1581411 RepID=A0ABT3GGT7_9BACT|nr:hypothetical protein [Luteolibacter arcticus]MCW1922829.1 hypothetical protein [Luteolibacter arcticus]
MNQLGIFLILMIWPVVADELRITYHGGWERGFELTFDYKKATVLLAQAKQGSIPEVRIQKSIKQPELAREFAGTIAKKLQDSKSDGAPADDTPYYDISFQRDADGGTITRVFVPSEPATKKLLFENKAELDGQVAGLDDFERRAILLWLAETGEAQRRDMASSEDRPR